MEWDFVPDQIIPYQLQIEYVGHYGIEDNEFDLYQVTKGGGAGGRGTVKRGKLRMKLSVIVPVYNTAADGKLEYCLEFP